MARFKHQSGQAGLIVLLIMVVITTVAVSVSTRSVSEMRISRQEQESTRTLNLAESGVEDLLKQDLDLVTHGFYSYSSLDDVEYTVTPQNTIKDFHLATGHTLEVNVHDASFIHITDWGNSANTALVVVLINSTGGLNRNIYNVGCGTCLGGGSPTSLPININVTGNELARIKVLYSSADLTLDRTCTGTCKPLFYQVETIARQKDGTTRAVTVNKFAGSLPSIFDYVLFSGTDLVK